MSEANPIANEDLVAQIRALGPWHHDIEINDSVSTGKVFSPTGKLPSPENEGVSLISPRAGFHDRLQLLYPEGMRGKRFLDCACNAGGYCFWARELGADLAVGFDVRDHWINQGKFVQQHRTAGPVDRIELHEMDLYDFPKTDYEPFDMTYFSGIFYHLPDPVTGLKIAADRTKDVLVLNTAMMPASETEETDLAGMTMALEAKGKLMSGVHTLSWFPNNPQTLERILRWLGFAEIVMTMDNRKTVPKVNLGPTHDERLAGRRRRVSYYAAREKGRLKELRQQLSANVLELG